VSRSSRIGEVENRLRFALESGDAERALTAARQLTKFQAPGDMALGTALRLALLLSRQGHPSAGRAGRRWIERAQTEIPDWQVVVVAEAALDGLGVEAIRGLCAELLEVVAARHEWTPVPAS
jgi:hypothetical protein